MALHAADLRLAEECLVRAADLGGLLLLYTSTGHAQVKHVDGMPPAPTPAASNPERPLLCAGHRPPCCAGKEEGQAQRCLRVLAAAGSAGDLHGPARRGRPCARGLLPGSHLPAIQDEPDGPPVEGEPAPGAVGRNARARPPRRPSFPVQVNPKAADSIADPADYPNLFDDLDLAVQARGGGVAPLRSRAARLAMWAHRHPLSRLPSPPPATPRVCQAESWLQSHNLQEAPASVYLEHAHDNESDLIEHMRALAANPPPEEQPTPGAAQLDAADEPVEEAEEEAEAVEAQEPELETELEADVEAEEEADKEVDAEEQTEAEVTETLVADENVDEALEALVEADVAGGDDDDLDAELDAELDAF
eukprot:scaffold7759_cov119-Isochrysis_galbana.AAC.10